MFSVILKLPNSKSKLIYYSTLLVNLIKKASKENKSLNLAPFVTNAVQSLFHNLDNMDIECVERLSLFFSYFLSNFQFNIDFDKFKEILTVENYNIKSVFFNIFHSKKPLARRKIYKEPQKTILFLVEPLQYKLYL